MLHICQLTSFSYDSPGPAKEAVSCSFASFANNLHAGDFLPAELWQLQITPPHNQTSVAVLGVCSHHHPGVEVPECPLSVSCGVLLATAYRYILELVEEHSVWK